ncbi:TPA: hypothetical protein ACOTG0_002092 [Clostridium perfringens]|nr:hypothetical protein phiCPD_00005 [Clostridium phage phiCp-D]
MKVICETCNKDFIFENDMLQVNYLGSMKTEIAYNCPNCGQKFIVGVMSAKARAIKREMEELKVIIDRKLKDNYKKMHEQEKILELRTQLLDEMNKYSKGDKQAIRNEE